MKTLYLIDGYAAIFRAFYAIRNPLHSSVTGEPTQATFVFANMLLKLYTTLHPDYVVVAWDTPGETFRDTLYGEYAALQAPPTVPLTPPPSLPQLPPVLSSSPAAAPTEPAEKATTPPTQTQADAPAEATPAIPSEPAPATVDQTTAPIAPPVAPPLIVPSYKGTRRDTPDDLHIQVPRIVQMLRIFGIPIIGEPKWEADDIIATLTGRVLDDPDCADVRVRIATRDKDMEQLIQGERVTLFDIHTGAELGEADLWAKRGITPQQVVDFLALTGDTVDNIPGVAGIGPKTAAKLLQQFGTIDGILSHLESHDGSAAASPLPGKFWENLEQARPTLPLSRRLVTLHHDDALPFSLQDAQVRPLPDIAADMVKFCDALGFNSIKKQCLLHVPNDAAPSDG